MKALQQDIEQVYFLLQSPFTHFIEFVDEKLLAELIFKNESLNFVFERDEFSIFLGYFVSEFD